MSDPTQTSPRASRVQQVIHHPARPWAQIIVGAGLMMFGGGKAAREPPTDKAHMIFEGAGIAIGLLLIPGIASSLAASIKQVGASLAPFVPWAKRDGGAP